MAAAPGKEFKDLSKQVKQFGADFKGLQKGVRQLAEELDKLDPVGVERSASSVIKYTSLSFKNVPALVTTARSSQLVLWKNEVLESSNIITQAKLVLEKQKLDVSALIFPEDALDFAKKLRSVEVDSGGDSASDDTEVEEQIQLYEFDSLRELNEMVRTYDACTATPGRKTLVTRLQLRLNKAKIMHVEVVSFLGKEKLTTLQKSRVKTVERRLEDYTAKVEDYLEGLESETAGASGTIRFNPQGTTVTPAAAAQTTAENAMLFSAEVMAFRDILDTLKPFNGGCMEFLAWKDSVKQLLALKSKSEVTKFNSLKKFLQGEPAKLVANVKAGQANPATEVMRLLEQEYGRKEIVVKAMYDKLQKLQEPNVNNYVSLRDFVLALKGATDTLKEVSEDINQPMLLDQITRRLPQATGKAWVKWSDHQRSTENLIRFLEIEVGALQRVAQSFRTMEAKEISQRQGQGQQPPKKATPAGGFAAVDQRGTETGGNNRQSRPCEVCHKPGHRVAQCYKYRDFPFGKKLAEAKRLRLHYRCLTCHPRAGPCPVPEEEQRCPVDPDGCKFSHHQLLHKQREEKQEDPAQEDGSAEAGMVAAAAKSSDSHYLRMVKVQIRSKDGGQVFETVVMHDIGCTRTYLDEKLAKKIGARLAEKQKMFVQGFHGSEAVESAKVQFQIKLDDGSWYQVKSASTKKDLAIKGPEVKWGEWKQQYPAFKKLPLENIKHEDVGIFLGLTDEILMLPLHPPSSHVVSPDGQYRAYKTRVGWTVSGPQFDGTPAGLCAFRAAEEVSFSQEALQEFKRFNDLEAIGIVKSPTELSRQEEADQKRLENSCTRLEDGRYQLAMLFKPIGPALPDSWDQAERRLYSLHKKLQRNSVLAVQYKKGIKEDEEKGYIRCLSNQEVKELQKGPHWVLPHFAVFHPDKPEKCRRVLDAAAKNGGISLNSMMTSGPNLLTSLMGVLLRFRAGKIAINGDITEMFPQVAVAPENEAMLAFLWSDSLSEKPKVYVNKRFIFGAKCSPSAANFVMKQIGQEAQGTVGAIISTCFYMDDLYWATDDEDEAMWTAKEIVQALLAGKFVLGKWVSNSEKFMAQWPKNDKAKAFKEMDTKDGQGLPKVKALGVAWDCSKDCLTFSCRQPEKEVKTPADALSVLAGVYDPMGIIGPFTLQGKLFMQTIWHDTANWNKQISAENKAMFEQWMKEIQVVAKLSIPRWFGLQKKSPATLHVFSDACNHGYGAVAYLAQEGCPTAFVASKSRVVNVHKTKQSQSVPRLELQGLLVGMRLAETLLKELGEVQQILKVVVWSDSVIVLYWLNKEETRFKPFVANRLREVHELAISTAFSSREVQFRHVPTDKNPADLVSRGLTAEQLATSFTFWTQGPEFLQDSSAWPANIVADPPAVDQEEVKKKEAVFVGVEDEAATALLPQEEEVKVTEFLKRRLGKIEVTKEELDDEEEKVFKEMQTESFSKEIESSNASQEKTVILQTGQLRKKQLMVDEKGILRLVTRLTQAEFVDYDVRYPIVLPAKHAAMRLLIRDAHEEVGHMGAKCTQNLLQQKFHVPGLNSAVRKELYICKVCRKIRPIQVKAPLAPLHENRLQVGKPAFYNTGMDHFGPMIIARGEKVWGLVFICLTTRAVHFELCKSTNLEKLMMAMDRFIQRRGKPEMIRSDLGSSFVRAANEQDKTVKQFEKDLQHQVVDQFRIKYETNPTDTPHWGGSWERMIGEVKKIIAASNEHVKSLNFDAVETLLVRAEGILNRRPIGIDENGLAICPNDIIAPAARRNGGFPLEASPVQMLQKTQAAIDYFWKKWTTSYLTGLSVNRVTGKAQNSTILLEDGDSVIVKDTSNALVEKWTVGKVVRVHKSSDGHIRSATVEVEGVETEKDIRKLAVFEGPVLSRKK